MLRLTLATIALTALAAQSFADQYSYTINTKDHSTYGTLEMGSDTHNSSDAYAWEIGNISLLPNHVITGATFTIIGIHNFEAAGSDDIFHLTMLDDATKITSLTKLTNVNVTNYEKLNRSTTVNQSYRSLTYNANSTIYKTSDAPNNQNYFGDAGGLYLGSYSDPADHLRSASMQNKSFAITDLALLQRYITNGSTLAFGLDSDCHYEAKRFSFSFVTEAQTVPEPAAVQLLAFGLAGLLGSGFIGRKKKN